MASRYEAKLGADVFTAIRLYVLAMHGMWCGMSNIKRDEAYGRAGGAVKWALIYVTWRIKKKTYDTPRWYESATLRERNTG